ncbi:hypothetical protein GLOIN_2v1547973 [Rhizophagus clarus]|uniref:Actin-like ATPase domain-containing protein n=1 Tax=Rhizophagus clarus TaxID=94130 RepID=A0A8H3L0G9_9GLOM|nr:hypothetical protein GLOIN_2v1547973 [Rhizophagus clarus]
MLDIRVVVGLALKYDKDFINVESWGESALSIRPSRWTNVNNQYTVVKLFELHELKEEHNFPVDYKKAITDYLREIGKPIKDTVTNEWNINFMENVFLVITVPDKYTQKEKAMMRECVFNAGLINGKYSKKLEFITELEAAAIYVIREYRLDTNGTILMIDCGENTVELATIKLLNENQLDEITERAGDYCGSSIVEKEFLNHLRKILDGRPMDLLRDNYYGQMQYMIKEFCQNVKFEFTGDDLTFLYEMDLMEVSPIIAQYVSDEVNQKMEKTEWLIKFDYGTIKSLFDPVVERILSMIRVQFENCNEKYSMCSTISLIGSFGKSPYLQKRIRDEFSDPGINIFVPENPIAAVSRGAISYGLMFARFVNDIDDGLMFIIDSRMLRFTYGIKVFNLEDSTYRFHPVAFKGTIAKFNDEFTAKIGPTLPFQKSGVFEIYYIDKCKKEAKEVKFGDPGITLLGKLKVDWPDKYFGLKRTILLN